LWPVNNISSPFFLIDKKGLKLSGFKLFLCFFQRDIFVNIALPLERLSKLN
jgi:hypothetical protein